jgi:hypothetical protein
MVDIPTAKHHGVCPVCEGYGGAADDSGCWDNPDCAGSCPKCWCPTCHENLQEITRVGQEIEGKP